MSWCGALSLLLMFSILEIFMKDVLLFWEIAVLIIPKLTNEAEVRFFFQLLLYIKAYKWMGVDTHRGPSSQLVLATGRPRTKDTAPLPPPVSSLEQEGPKYWRGGDRWGRSCPTLAYLHPSSQDLGFWIGYPSYSIWSTLYMLYIENNYFYISKPWISQVPVNRIIERSTFYKTTVKAEKHISFYTFLYYKTYV